MSEITPDLLKQLTRIADALERLANDGKPVAPEMRRPISEYAKFDWPSIGASVVAADADGPTHVEYAGTIWTRRSPTNKFGAAIWFSRSSGAKDADGNVIYLRLITFQEIHDADPISKKAAELSRSKPAESAVQTPPPDASQPSERSAFLSWATSKAFGLPKETAVWLLDKVDGDYVKARALIPVVAEGKAAGLDGKAVAGVLAIGLFDPIKSFEIMRARTMPASLGKK